MGKVIQLKKLHKGGVKQMSLARDINNIDANKELLKIILFFTSNSTNLIYKTKLNKLLFYAQFLYYKKYKKVLINKVFIKDYYGPVVEDLDVSLCQFKKMGVIDVLQTRFGEVIKSPIRLNMSNFEKQELEVLHKVINEFDRYTSREISDYSHEELLWIKARYKDEIKIEEAYLLNEF